jgi:glutamyl-tRNA synthetase/nondiscriminating glutamyl-tRNA synthetase
MNKVRFAPSPTGFLHIGNARTALFNHLFARHTKGLFLVRIEDTDKERSKPEYEKALLEDLRWLGLDWDEEPVRQSERTQIHREALKKLEAEGRVYRCFCTAQGLEKKRAEALKEKRPPRYDGTCRNIPSKEAEERAGKGEPFTYRFKISEPLVEFDDLIKGHISVDLDNMVGDFVVARQDGSPTFHLAVCVDDSEMGITHVIRGEDHLSNTPRHILIFKALGKTPPRFAHMPLILGEKGQPLSKRMGDFSIRQFRAEGAPAEGLINYLSLLGWSAGDDREILTRDELESLFAIEKVNTSPARFDAQKLRWVLHEHFQRIADSDLEKGCLPFLKSASSYEGRELTKRLVFLKDSSATFKGLAERFEAVFGEKTVCELDDESRKITGTPLFKEALQKIKEILERSSSEELEGLSVYTEALRPLGLKGAGLFKPLRLILTGSLHGAELKLLLPLIPRSLALRRIAKLESRIKEER